MNETYDYQNFDLLGEYWSRYEGDFSDDNKVYFLIDNYYDFYYKLQYKLFLLILKHVN